MKRFKLADWLLLGVVALTFAVGAIFYGRLPTEVPIHWGAGGAVDRFAPKSIGAFVSPVVSLVVFVYARLERNCRRNTGVVARIVMPFVFLALEGWIVWRGMQ